MRALPLAVLLLLSSFLMAQPGAWTQENPSPPWSGRHMQKTITFNGELWMLGGYTTTFLNDIWRSSDGINWVQVQTGTPMWGPRRSHTVAVFNNRLWVIGGADGTNLNQVWSSPDGINWTQDQPSAAFPPRGAHATVVYDNKLWIFGGYNGAGMADVWSSTDGVTWVQSQTPPWPARYHHQAAVFDGKMWIFGGLGGGNDVWWSTDGNNWTQVIPGPAAPMWPSRYGHMVEVFDDRLWVMGGSWSSTSYSDVWTSSDGLSWTEESPAAGWVGRRYGTCAVMDNKIWIMTGYNGAANVADVWSYEGPPLISSTPGLTAAVGATYTYDIVASGYPAPVVAVSGLPAWLTRAGDTLTGAPAVGDIGLSPMITVTATNTSGVDTQAFQIDVQGVPPQITSTPQLTATAGVPWSYAVTASGEPAPALSVSPLPGWLMFNATTGELSGTPTGADAGSNPQIDITATNGWAPDAAQSFSISVEGVPPAITSTPGTSVTVGELYTYTINGTGEPAPTPGVSGNPAWLTLNGNVLSGTPDGADVGPTPAITVTLSNGWAPDATQTFTIDVFGVAPTFTSAPVTSATPQSLYTYTATATGTPTPSLSVTSVLPTWLSFNATTGELSGTPTNGDAKTNVSVTLTASNSVAPDGVQTFVISVGRSPDAQKSGGDGGGCSSRQAYPWYALLVLLAVMAAARHRVRRAA